MSDFPLVSILIPTYNQNPDFLRACINSSINQTYKNIEVIVSDNHSTDALIKDVLAEFTPDTRFRVVQPDVHVTMIENFCFVADNAYGEYLSFLSSDDLLESNAVEFLVEALLKSTDSKLAFGEVEYVKAKALKHIHFERDFKLISGTYSAKEFLSYYLKKYGVWMIGNLINKDEYYKMGGIKTDNIYYNHDTVFLFKWLNEGNTVTYVNVLVGKFRIWEDENQKADSNREMKGVIDIISTYNLILKSKYIISEIGLPRIINLKNKHLEEIALHWSVKFIKGKVSKEDINNVKLSILKDANTARARLYFLCCSNPIKSVLNFGIKLKNKFN